MISRTIISDNYTFIIPCHSKLKKLINSKDLFKEMNVFYTNKIQKSIISTLQLALKDLLIIFDNKYLFDSSHLTKKLTNEDKYYLLNSLNKFIEIVINILKDQLINLSLNLIQPIVTDTISLIGGIVANLFALIFDISPERAINYLFSELTNNNNITNVLLNNCNNY